MAKSEIGRILPWQQLFWNETVRGYTLKQTCFDNEGMFRNSLISATDDVMKHTVWLTLLLV